MSAHFICTLPCTGSKKNQKVPTPRGVMPSAKAKRDKALITEAIRLAMFEPDPRRAGNHRMRLGFPMTPPYRVWLRLPIGHRTDVDNAAGHPFDCLKYAGVIVDDRAVCDARQTRENRNDIRLEVWSVDSWETKT